MRFLVSKQAEGCFQYLFSFVCLVLVTAEFLSPFLNQILLFRVFLSLCIIGIDVIWQIFCPILSMVSSDTALKLSHFIGFHLLIWVLFSA